jgi:hypothetical protein
MMSRYFCDSFTNFILLCIVSHSNDMTSWQSSSAVYVVLFYLIVCGLFKWICAGFISFVYKCVAMEDPIIKKQKLLNKAILLLGWSHHCKNSTIVITTWLTAMAYSYLKWQWIFYFLSRFVSLLYHCQDFYMTWLYIWATRWMSYENFLPFVSTTGFLSDSCCSSF